MDEVSSHVCLVLPSTDGKAARKIVPPRLRIPYWKGLGADSEEKHEPVSDIDTVVVDSLKALDPKRPIREADIAVASVRNLILTRDCVRRPGVGGGQISRTRSARTGGPPSYAKSSELIRKAHLCELHHP
jgi:hypothetical protein